MVIEIEPTAVIGQLADKVRTNRFGVQVCSKSLSQWAHVVGRSMSLLPV